MRKINTTHLANYLMVLLYGKNALKTYRSLCFSSITGHLIHRNVQSTKEKNC